MTNDRRIPNDEIPTPASWAEARRIPAFLVSPVSVERPSRAATARPFLSPAQRAGDTPTVIVLRPNGARFSPIHTESIVRFAGQNYRGLSGSIRFGHPSPGRWPGLGNDGPLDLPDRTLVIEIKLRPWS